MSSIQKVTFFPSPFYFTVSGVRGTADSKGPSSNPSCNQTLPVFSLGGKEIAFLTEREGIFNQKLLLFDLIVAFGHEVPFIWQV